MRTKFEPERRECNTCGKSFMSTRCTHVYCSRRCGNLYSDRHLRLPRDRQSYYRLRTYGVTPEHFAEMLIGQDGRCAICRRPESCKRRKNEKYPRLLSIDHDHHTNVVRELLCNGCNTAIGKLTTPELLETAAAYLRKHQGNGESRNAGEPL